MVENVESPRQEFEDILDTLETLKGKMPSDPNSRYSNSLQKIERIVTSYYRAVGAIPSEYTL